MTTAKGHYQIPLLLPFLLLLVPLSAQEPRRDSRHPLDAPAEAHDDKAAEQSLWDSIRDGMDPRAYRTYLIKFPQGQFKDEARARLGALLGEDYVALFTKRVSVNRQWANVERQLRRRADLIPLLISTLQEAGVHEPELFGQIAEARSSLLDAMSASPQGEEDNKTPEQKRTVIDADNGFGGILRRVDSLLENYPQLRSNEKFLKMQDEFAGVENRASVAQADYNGAVQEYNTARSQPQVAALAEQHGFTEEPYFKSEQAQPAEPRIKRA